MTHLASIFTLLSLICLIIAPIEWVRSLISGSSREEKLKMSLAGAIFYTAALFFSVLRGACSLIKTWSGSELAINVVMFFCIFLGISWIAEKRRLLKELERKEEQAKEASPKERLADLRRKKTQLEEEIIKLEAEEETKSGLVFRQNGR